MRKVFKVLSAILILPLVILGTALLLIAGFIIFIVSWIFRIRLEAEPNLYSTFQQKQRKENENGGIK